MRAATPILAVFCALISGFTASLARTQGQEGMAPAHHAAAMAGNEASALSGGTACPPAAKGCDRHAHTVHPMLCAACFATATDTHHLDRVALAAPPLRPRLHRPMRAVFPEPQFPPPKSSLSI